MNPQKQKQLMRIAEVVDKGSIAIIRYIQELEDKIDLEIPSIKDVISRVKGEPGKTPTREEIMSLIEPLIPQIEQPKDGNDYVLTPQDKLDIASSIKVPVVKQIIEKTEVVKEQPIITNNTIEKKIENPFTLYGEDIVRKINDLDTYPDNQIDAKHIKNLPKTVNNIMAGGTNGIIQIVAGSGITVDNSNMKYPIVSSTGSGSGWTVSTPTGALYDQNTGTGGINFTSSGTATIVWADGLAYFNGAGCTISGTSITMDNPVTQFIRVGV